MSLAGSEISQPFLIPNSTVTPNMMANTVFVTGTPTNGANSAVSTTLTFALSPNTTYLFDAALTLTNTGGSTASLQIHALASGASLVFVGNTGHSFTNTFIGGATTSVSANISTAQAGANLFFRLAGCITVGANATTLQIDFLDDAAAGTVTVTGGYLQVSA